MTTTTAPRFTAARDRAGLTDVDPTTIACWRDRRTGRDEIRDCRSTDGAWAYTRTEDTGTTWTVTHLPTGRVLHREPSLPKARQATASGWALAELDRQERQAARPRCTWRGRWTSAICLMPTDGGDRCGQHGSAA